MTSTNNPAAPEKLYHLQKSLHLELVRKLIVTPVAGSAFKALPFASMKRMKVPLKETSIN